MLYGDRSISELQTFIKRLKRAGLPRQQFLTIKGQAIAGDLNGAQKGLERLLRERKERKEA